MPAHQNPLGALPARFRRPRLLIVGCGDVGLRAARELGAASGAQRCRVLALTSDPQRLPLLRAAGITALVGDLDRPASLRRLAGLATRVLHLAPPPGLGTAGQGGYSGLADPRTVALVRTLRRGAQAQALVYVSTSGVYGDCAGQWVSETRPVRPMTARARRRVHAEASLRALGRSGVRVSLLRAPGIYASDRAGGTPRERLLRGAPALVEAEDVHTNHIHADDLARACLLALWRGRPQRACNISDASGLKLGQYLDLAADRYGLPRPPRLTRAQAALQLSPLQMSFLGESRRLLTQRMERELGLQLRYPTVLQGLQAGLQRG